MSHLAAIVLAAGQGTRMKSAVPKVLHEIAGVPMLEHVVRAAQAAGADEIIVVVGHGREAVTAHLASQFGESVRTVVQEVQKGTGHAGGCALPLVTADRVMVLCGDTPLVRPETLRALVVGLSDRARMAMLTCMAVDPSGYGRILREGGRVVAIREQKDCSEEERSISEVNPGVYVFHTSFLREALPQLGNNNAQGELYLTDTVALAAAHGVATLDSVASDLIGVNDRVQLAQVEGRMHSRIADAFRLSGVTVREGALIDARVAIARDATIEANTVLRGLTIVGERARIDVGSVLTDAVVGEGVEVKPYSVITSATVGPRAQIGPFSHLRPKSDIHEDAHIGNFVETKSTTVRRGAKANHLAYLGDGDIGEGANVGAGTIFCNYDGFQKHRTVIGKGAFIGSDSQLVAPVTVGDGAYVGTGTCVTKDVPPDALAIARTPQENKLGYAPRIRNRMKAAAAAAKAAKG